MIAMDQIKAEQAFSALVDCLNVRFRHKFFVVDGTLLGMMREGYFIKGDNDIDFAMWIEDYDPQIVDDLKQAGFSNLQPFGTPEDGLQFQLDYAGVQVDIRFCYRRGGKIHSTSYRHGKKLLSASPEFQVEERLCLGKKVMIPSPAEDFLEYAYGPKWRQPVKRWKWQYNSRGLKPEGSMWWRFSYRIRRAIWLLRTWNNHHELGAPLERRVYADGVFDLLHVNHVKILQEAASFGTRLIVGVMSDALTESYKRTPVIHEDERLEMVKNIKCVDEAFIVRDPLEAATLEKIITQRGIDAVVYAGNATPEFYHFADSQGIMRRIPYHSGTSTSEIIERVSGRADVEPT